MINFEKVNIELLDPNTGQIPGVPRNPRKWTHRALEQLRRDHRALGEIHRPQGYKDRVI